MCIGIKLQNEVSLLLANNYDTPQGVGYLFTNRRGVKKYAFIQPPETPHRWTSKYGSITFNQSGKEFPCEGMNEAGLVVIQATLPQTVFPAVDERPAVSELQFIQFLLDTCTSTEKALEAVHKVRIGQTVAPLQYMIMDSSGDIAILEFVEEKARIYTGADITIPVIANSSYEDSLLYASGDRSRYKNDSPYGRNSLLRYEKAVEKLKNVPQNEDLKEYAFASLDATAREDNQWQIVYSPREKAVYYRTREQRNIKYVLLNELRLGEKASPEYLWMDKPVHDNISQRLAAYTPEINKELAYFFFRNPLVKSNFGLNPTDAQLDFFAAYPDTFESI